jgi:hypothetical protein
MGLDAEAPLCISTRNRSRNRSEGRDTRSRACKVHSSILEVLYTKWG